MDTWREGRGRWHKEWVSVGWKISVGSLIGAKGGVEFWFGGWLCLCLCQVCVCVRIIEREWREQKKRKGLCYDLGCCVWMRHGGKNSKIVCWCGFASGWVHWHVILTPFSQSASHATFQWWIHRWMISFLFNWPMCN